MAFNYSRLTPIQYIPPSASVVFTNPASMTSYVRVILLHNNDSTVETVSLYAVPASGGVAGVASAASCFYTEAMPAGETRIIDIPVPGIMLTNINETIQAITTSANMVTMQMMGGQE